MSIKFSHKITHFNGNSIKFHWCHKATMYTMVRWLWYSIFSAKLGVKDPVPISATDSLKRIGKMYRPLPYYVKVKRIATVLIGLLSGQIMIFSQSQIHGIIVD